MGVNTNDMLPLLEHPWEVVENAGKRGYVVVVSVVAFVLIK